MDDEVVGAAPGPRSRARVFVSYSHDDADAVRALGDQLAFYAEELEVFVDTHELEAGDRFDVAIDAAIDRADFAVLLVSPSFHASAYIRDHELPRLQTRGIDLAWVLCRPCPWDRIDAVRDRNALHELERDRGGGPISLLAPNQQEAAWYEIARAVAAKGQTVLVERGAGGSPGGALHAVPPPPLRLLERADEQGALIRALVDPGGPRRVVAVGPPGSGKSVLAAAVVHRTELRERFPDGVHWLTVGRGADGRVLLRRLARQLGLPDEAERSAEAVDRLRRALVDRRLLLVADDVWEPAVLDWLGVTGPDSRLLVTSPDPAVAQTLDARTVEVGPLGADDVARFLQEATGEPPPPETVPEILRLTDGVAAGLATVAGTVRAGTAWPDLLPRADPTAAADPTDATHGAHDDAATGPAATDPGVTGRRALVEAVERSVAALGDGGAHDLRRRYAELAVFAPNVAVPVPVAADLWGVGVGEAAPALAELRSRSLLHDAEVGGGSAGAAAFSLDEHQMAGARRQSRALRPALRSRDLHRRVLEAYRRRLASPGGGWGTLAIDEPYLWDQLFRHLSGAEDPVALAEAAADDTWLVRRLWRSGDTFDAENDLALAVETLGDASPAATRLRRIRQRAGSFRRLPDERSVAATVAFHLDVRPDVGPDGRLGGNAPWLTPLDPSPAAPDALVRVLAGHTGAATACAFGVAGPGPGVLATCGWDDTVRLVDPRSGRLVRPPLPGGAGAPVAIALDPSGTMVAVTGRDGGARVWEVRTGGLLGGGLDSPMAAAHGGTATACAFSPDGGLLATTGDDGIVRLWELPGCTPRGPGVDAASGALTWCRFVPDGSGLVVTGRDGTIRRLDLDGAPGWTVPPVGTEGITCAALSPDGSVVATGGPERIVRLWRTDDAAATGATPGHDEAVTGCAFSPDGAVLATVGLDRTARLWDVATGRPVGPPLTDHGEPLTGCAFSPDASLLATTAADGTVLLWDVATLRAGPAAAVPATGTGAPTALSVVVDVSEPRTGAPLSACAVADGGRVVVVADRDGRVSARAADDGHALGELRLATPLSALEVVTEAVAEPVEPVERAVPTEATGGVVGQPLERPGGQPPARLLVAGGDDGELRPIALAALVGPAAVREDGPGRPPRAGPHGLRLGPGAATGDDVPELPTGPVAVTAMAHGPEGWLAVAGDDGGWRRVETRADGDPWALVTATVVGHEGPLGAIAVDPRGTLVATGGWDGLVRLWDARSGAAVGEALGAHADTVATCAFSPDGRVLASGSWDGSVALWDVRSGTRLGPTLDAHTDWVTAAAFAEGGRLLVTTGNDERIRLWDPGDGSCLLTLRVGRPLGCLAVDGSLVVVGAGRHLQRFRLRTAGAPDRPQ